MVDDIEERQAAEGRFLAGIAHERTRMASKAYVIESGRMDKGGQNSAPICGPPHGSPPGQRAPLPTTSSLPSRPKGRMNKAKPLTQEFIDKRRAERRHLQAERGRAHAKTHETSAEPPKGDVRALVFDCEHGRLVERFASVEEALGHIANFVDLFFGNDDEMDYLSDFSVSFIETTEEWLDGLKEFEGP